MGRKLRQLAASPPIRSEPQAPLRRNFFPNYQQYTAVFHDGEFALSRRTLSTSPNSFPIFLVRVPTEGQEIK